MRCRASRSRGPGGLHGSLCDLQLLGDLGIREAVRDQLDHLRLALAERHVIATATAAVGRRQHRPEPRVQVVSAVDRGPERLQQLGRLGLLQDVAPGTRAQRLAGVLGVLSHRQDRDRKRGMGDEHLWQGPEARPSRHRQVERQQIRLQLADLADHRGDVGRFGHDRELSVLALEHRADAVADDRVVVSDDDLDRTAQSSSVMIHQLTP